MNRVKFSCGHELDFTHAPPKKGDWMLCRICDKTVRAVGDPVPWEKIKPTNKVSIWDLEAYGPTHTGKRSGRS